MPTREEVGVNWLCPGRKVKFEYSIRAESSVRTEGQPEFPRAAKMTSALVVGGPRYST